MPIKPPSSTNIAYLTSYIPFGFPQVELTLIEDMVSVNIPTQLLTGNIDYRIGTVPTPQSYTTSITNLTSNAVLEVTFYFSSPALISRGARRITEVDRPNRKLVQNVPAGNIITNEFFIYKENLNSSSNYEKYNLDFSVQVKNLTNGSIVFKQ